MRICIHQPPAESPRRTKGAPENLQPALQQFGVEVLVPGNRDSHKLVLVASFDCVSDHFLGPLPGAGFDIVHFDFVAHVGVEVSFALQTLTNVPLPFFEEVRIDGPFLVNGYQSFELSVGELRASHGYFHARPLRYFKENRGGVFCGIEISPPYGHTRTEVTLLRKKLPDTFRPAPQSRRGDGLAYLHFEPRQKAGILVRGVIL